MRLKREGDFRRVMRRRCRVADGNLVMYLCPNGLQITRLGLSVGRRLGSAVKRNRIKRLVREAFRLEQIGLTIPSFDIVCVPQPGSEPGLTEYRKSMRRLMKSGAARCTRE